MNNFIENSVNVKQLNMEKALDKKVFSHILNPIELSTFKEILTLKKIYKCVYVSHEYLAHKLGKTRSYICRIIKRLSSLGIIEFEKRSNNTHVYHVNKQIYEPKLYAFLIMLFTNTVIFSLCELRSDRIGTQCISLDFNLYKEGAPLVLPMSAYVAHDWSPVAPWPPCAGTTMEEPTQKYSFEQFNAIFFASSEEIDHPTTQKLLKGESMSIFTNEQLQQIAQFPQEAIQRANDRLKQVTAKGNRPHTVFPWFMAILKSWKPGEGQAASVQAAFSPKGKPYIPKAYVYDDAGISERLRQRRIAIRQQAEDEGIPDVRYRSLGDLERILAGIVLPPVTQSLKDAIDKTLNASEVTTNYRANESVIEEKSITWSKADLALIELVVNAWQKWKHLANQELLQEICQGPSSQSALDGSLTIKLRDALQNINEYQESLERIETPYIDEGSQWTEIF